MTGVKGVDPKRHLYCYSLVISIFLCYSYLSDSTIRTRVFTYLPIIISDWCKGCRPETSFIFLLLGTEIFLCYSHLSDSTLRTSTLFTHSSCCKSTNNKSTVSQEIYCPIPLNLKPINDVHKFSPLVDKGRMKFANRTNNIKMTKTTLRKYIGLPYIVRLYFNTSKI